MRFCSSSLAWLRLSFGVPATAEVAAPGGGLPTLMPVGKPVLPLPEPLPFPGCAAGSIGRRGGIAFHVRSARRVGLSARRRMKFSAAISPRHLDRTAHICRIHPRAISLSLPARVRRSPCMLGCGGAACLARRSRLPRIAATCAGTGSFGASTCGCNCAMLSWPALSFSASADTEGSTAAGCASSELCLPASAAKCRPQAQPPSGAKLRRNQQLRFQSRRSAVGSTTCG